jgi:uncharacterized repeat protein (TIGR02543 family)
VDTIAGENFPANPTRTGYNFAGWNTAPAGSGSPFTASTTVNADITVYAQWTGETYTVTFKSNDGTDTTLYAKTVTVPATTIDAGNFPADPTRTGHTFTGWNTVPAGTESGFIATTTVSGNMTVYAQWAETYTVTFKYNNGTDTPLYTKTVIVPATTIGAADFPADPTRTGYIFGGWYAGSNGGGSAFTASTMVTGDITVYAWWATGGLILLNPDAGDGAFTQTDFTLSKSGTGYPTSQIISITGSDYVNPRWFVDGAPKGTETNITIGAADYAAGGHILSLIINKSGVFWSKEISFTVVN